MVNNKLGTDRYEKKHGLIYAKVLRHTKHIREVFLVDNRGIKHEYAITLLSNMAHKVPLVSEKIKNGGLIGKTFRDHGYKIVKKDKEDFTVNLPPDLQRVFDTSKKTAEASIYEFCFNKERKPLQTYGTILEIYNPCTKQ